MQVEKEFMTSGSARYSVETNTLLLFNKPELHGYKTMTKYAKTATAGNLLREEKKVNKTQQRSDQKCWYIANLCVVYNSTKLGN